MPNDLGYQACKSCYQPTVYPEPEARQIEWEAGSDRVCSFVWTFPAFGEVVVIEEVRQALAGLGPRFLPVRFHQDARIARPRRITKRTKPRVWLPYEGPPLHLLWLPTWVHADLDRSSLTLAKTCAACGHKEYQFHDGERWEWHVDMTTLAVTKTRIPRKPSGGISVHRQDLQGAEIFRLHERPAMILCTERVKSLIEDRRFGNALLLEVGDVLA